MMESIEKLRGWLDYKINHYDHGGNAIVLNTGTDPNELYDIADEIEREIAERYMELPVDAGGVPIRVGDHMECDGEAFTVCAVAPGRVHRWKVGIIGESETVSIAYPPCQCRHVKPRTIEDVLKEFGKAYTYVDGECASTTTLIADYADELRSMAVGE